MEENSLEYEKQIWNVFSIGVVASIVILYFVLQGDLGNGKLEIATLLLGFAILLYCSFSILGYGKKIRIIREKGPPLLKELKKSWYPRTRWMGELILFCLVFVYSYITYLQIEINEFGGWLMGIMAPLFILEIFIFLSVIANVLANKKTN